MFNLPVFDLIWLLPIIIALFAVTLILRGGFYFYRKTMRKLRGEPTTKWQIQERMQEILNFSAEDLEHNRTFKSATIRQRLRLVPEILWGLTIALIFGYFAWTNILGEVGQEGVSTLSGFVAWVRDPIHFSMFLVLGLVSAPALYRSAVGTGEILLGTLYFTEGPGGKFVQRGRRSSQYLITVGGVSCKVPGEFYTDFIPDHTYHAYYFPRSKRLASIEIVQMWETNPADNSKLPDEINDSNN